MLNFNREMTALVREIVQNVSEFQMIDLDRVGISASFCKSRRKGGLLAYVLPLKFEAGSPVQTRTRGKKVYHWAMLPHYIEGKELLYIIYFLLPRFYNLSLKDKLHTIVHELYHISPHFNGDLRRFKGRSVFHGSLKTYEQKVNELTTEFLNKVPDGSKYAFLKESYLLTERAYQGIRAKHIQEPKPKLLKVASVGLTWPSLF